MLLTASDLQAIWLTLKVATLTTVILAVIGTPLATPRKAVASEPMATLAGMSRAPARTQSSLARSASISMRPMRPEAPATATRQGEEEGAGAVVPVMSFLVCMRSAGAAGAARFQRTVDSSGG